MLLPREMPLPLRPAIPPILVCSLCLWAGCAAAYYLAQNGTAFACIVVCSISATFAFVTIGLVWKTRGSVLIFCALLGLFAGVVCGGAGGAGLHSKQQAAFEEPFGCFRLEILEDSSVGLHSATSRARTTLLGGQTIDVQLRFDREATVPRYGEVVEAEVSFALPSLSQKDRCWQQGIAAVAAVREFRSVDRQDMLRPLLDLRSRAISLIEAQAGEGSAVLRALLCGDRAALGETDIYESFKVAGLAHLIAVSGAHLVVVCAFVGIVLKMARLPRALTLGIQAALLLGYLVFAGAPISAVRAVITTTAGMFSFFAHRRPASLNALGLCIVALIACDPHVSLSVSFALSALSTLGIVLFAGLLGAWVRHILPRVPPFVLEALSLTLASCIVVQPLSCALFSQLSLVSPLANIVTAPLFPLICAGGLIALVLSMLIAPVGGAALSVVVLITEALCMIVRFCATIPYASIPVIASLGGALAASTVLGVLLWLWWPKPSALMGAGVLAGVTALLVVIVIIVPRFSETEIIMLDVGQGDAIVLRSGKAAVLVDTGNQDKLLREGLARHGIYHLDAVLITHGDDDHAGALASLKGIVSVDRVLLAAEARTCLCEACAMLRVSADTLVGESGVQGLAVGETIHVGTWALKVIWPQRFTAEGGNADSLCLLAQADTNKDEIPDWSALFTGDAEHEQLTEMLKQGLVGKVDILKVGHHGSKNALTLEVAQALDSQLALISVGAKNRYGHPTEDTLQILADAGATVKRTDQEGDVSCILQAEEIAVRTVR